MNRFFLYPSDLLIKGHPVETMVWALASASVQLIFNKVSEASHEWTYLWHLFIPPWKHLGTALWSIQRISSWYSWNREDSFNHHFLNHSYMEKVYQPLEYIFILTYGCICLSNYFFKIIHRIWQIASCYIFVIDVISRMALGNTEHCTRSPFIINMLRIHLLYNLNYYQYSIIALPSKGAVRNIWTDYWLFSMAFMIFSIIIHKNTTEDKQIDSSQLGQRETRENIYLVIH